MRTHNLVLLLTAVSTTGASAQTTPSQADLAAALRHQEGLVRSMEASYQITVRPTPLESVARLRELAKKYKQPILVPRYWVKEEMARSDAKRVNWWRKGEKERIEVSSLSGKRDKTTAFDGSVARTVTPGAASLERLEKAHLRDTFRSEPFDLLYECCGTPYSEVVRTGRDFSASALTRNGQPLVRVFLRQKTHGLPFLFLFDAQHRIVERHLLTENSTSEHPVYTNSCLFSDYQAHLDPSGETIWFPKQAVLVISAVFRNEPSSIEVRRDTLSFSKVRFNTDIPDSQFVLELPPSVEIYDGVSGQGWIPPGSNLSAWSDPPPPPRARNWLWLWAVAGGGLLLSALAAVGWLRRKRRLA